MDPRFKNINIYDSNIFKDTIYSYKDLFFNSFIQDFLDYPFDFTEYNKVRNYRPKTTEEKLLELTKCAKDPIYFIYKYAVIKEQEEGLKVMDLFPYQAWFIREVLQKNRFNVVLKSRQIGLTTVSCAFSAWLMIFKESSEIAIFSTTADKSKGILKKIKIILDNLPNFFYESYNIGGSVTTPVKYTQDGRNAMTLRLINYSEASALAMTEDAGISTSNAFIIIDEAAICDLKRPKQFELVWQGLLPTVTSGGRALVISTPRGIGGIFYDLCIKGRDEMDPKFKLTIFPWYVKPSRDMNWLYEEYKALSRERTKKAMAQEHLCSFEASGETILSIETIEYYEKNYLLKPAFKDNFGVWIWQQPRTNGKYALFADVAEGNGDQADFSAFHIFDIETMEQVAEFMNDKITIDDYANVIVEFAKKYNEALISIESNSFGLGVIKLVLKEEYKNLICHKKSEYDKFDIYKDNQDESIMKTGIATTVKSRPMFVASWQNKLEKREIIVHSQRSIEQFKTFVYRGRKPEAMIGFHDDLIIPMAQYALLSEQLNSLYYGKHIDNGCLFQYGFKISTPLFNSKRQRNDDIMTKRFYEDLSK